MPNTNWELIFRGTVYTMTVGLLAITSIAMNMAVGFEVGQPIVPVAIILAIVAMCSDILKAYLPFMWLRAFQEVRPAYLGCLVVLGALMIGYSWCAGYAFSTTHRLVGSDAARNQATAGELKSRELARLDAELSRRTTERSPAEIEAEIAALLQTRVGGRSVDAHTNGCTTVETYGPQTCAKVAELRIELAAARRHEDLMRQRAALLEDRLGALANATPTDGAAFALAQLLGASIERVQIGIGIVFTTLCELANLFALVLYRRLIRAAPRAGHGDGEWQPTGGGFGAGGGAPFDGGLLGAGQRCPSGGDCPHEGGGGRAPHAPHTNRAPERPRGLVNL
ncbi:MAG: hypothetical protein GC150_07440 [Rhizobiales bacterium]|nr:hypothetical protein [Hyphomicrobiales bacterium]